MLVIGQHGHGGTLCVRWQKLRPPVGELPKRPIREHPLKLIIAMPALRFVLIFRVDCPLGGRSGRVDRRYPARHLGLIGLQGKRTDGGGAVDGAYCLGSCNDLMVNQTCCHGLLPTKNKLSRFGELVDAGLDALLNFLLYHVLAYAISHCDIPE